MLKKFENYINGSFQPPVRGRYLDTSNPYTTEPWGQIAHSDASDVDAAVSAASQAFLNGPWSKMSAPQRGEALRSLASAVLEHAEELAHIEVRDNGKTLKEMLPQVKRIADWLHFYAGLADKINGSVLPTERPGFLNYTRREPLGVIGMITPWNSPLMLLIWKLAPALAAGNTAVVKPSEFTSVSAVRFAEIAKEAGIPDGVINVITGLGNEAGAALASHPDISKVAFTGGIGGGKAVYKLAADRLIPITLELGGKSPQLVFPDANLETAARGIVSGIFGSGGQSCVAGSRALIHSDVHDELVERMVELTGKIRLGDPMSDDTDIGPVATRPQFDHIMKCVDAGKEDGAELVIGGTQVDDPAGGKGLFVAPTIFTGVRSFMRIAQEEVFGPVLSVLKFNDEDEAVAIANDSAFGLGAGIWTKDLARAHSVASKIQAGTVWVNSYKGVSQLSPFGGYKNSGIGREGGMDMIAAYLQTKSVWINLNDEVPYGFPI